MWAAPYTSCISLIGILEMIVSSFSHILKQKPRYSLFVAGSDIRFTPLLLGAISFLNLFAKLCLEKKKPECDWPRMCPPKLNVMDRIFLDSISRMADPPPLL